MPSYSSVNWFAGFILVCLLVNQPLRAQQQEIDSLKRRLARSAVDTSRAMLLNELGYQYHLFKPDTTYRLGQQGYELSRILSFRPGESRGLNVMAVGLVTMGDYPRALQLYQQALTISESINDTRNITRIINNIADLYGQQKEYSRALTSFLRAKQIFQTAGLLRTRSDSILLSIINTNIGESYLNLGQLDSADYYLQQAFALANRVAFNAILGNVTYDLGDVQARKNKPAQALTYYRRSVRYSQQENTLPQLAEAYLRIARFYQKANRTDSSIVNANRALRSSQQSSYLPGILSASQLLSQAYEGRDNVRALRYYKVAVAAKDSLFSQDKVKQMLTLSFEETQRRQEIDAARAAYWNRIRTYGLLGAVGVFVLVALLLWRTNRRQQQSNTLLSRQKTEIEHQRAKSEQAYAELQVTQTQLIQKEKMASLGELTAGIAHEIQNPLNFVNNFSEVSAELVDELRRGPMQQLPDPERAYADEILSDLTQNLQKIHKHGQRADSIVKGMLAHSRTATGEKRLTDLNALADEYLKLAHSGLQVRDKTFRAELITDFDPHAGSINIAPQDIGRVLLNLYHNAFYAVQEKQKQQPANYQPQVTVHTQAVDGHVQVRVKDNGTGIPQALLPKIYQPFFTTKPAGQGTGLGLSLSYDIVTKGHQGQLSVVSEEGQGTEMIIELPFTSPLPV